MTHAQWEAWIHDTFPATWGGRGSPAQAVLAPYRERIEAALQTNHVTTVWQRLCDDTGLAVSLSTFRRCSGTFEHPPPARDVTVWRDPIVPGVEDQVDFGKMGVCVRSAAAVHESVVDRPDFAVPLTHGRPPRSPGRPSPKGLSSRFRPAKWDGF